MQARARVETAKAEAVRQEPRASSFLTNNKAAAASEVNLEVPNSKSQFYCLEGVNFRLLFVKATTKKGLAGSEARSGKLALY